MISYRFLENMSSAGEWVPFGVAYTRGNEVLLFVPAWRSPRKLIVNDLRELNERFFPSGKRPYRWADEILSWRESRDFHPIDIFRGEPPDTPVDAFGRTLGSDWTQNNIDTFVPRNATMEPPSRDHEPRRGIGFVTPGQESSPHRTRPEVVRPAVSDQASKLRQPKVRAGDLILGMAAAAWEGRILRVGILVLLLSLAGLLVWSFYQQSRGTGGSTETFESNPTILTLPSDRQTEPDLSRATIQITTIPPADPEGGDLTSEEIAGVVTGIPEDYLENLRIVLYARPRVTWYVQPTDDAPFTAIEADGRWSASIHTGRTYAALLVLKSFDPPRRPSALPAEGGDVIEVVVREGR